jgi:hypothetical protein
MSFLTELDLRGVAAKYPLHLASPQPVTRLDARFSSEVATNLKLDFHQPDVIYFARHTHFFTPFPLSPLISPFPSIPLLYREVEMFPSLLPSHP